MVRSARHAALEMGKGTEAIKAAGLAVALTTDAFLFRRTPASLPGVAIQVYRLSNLADLDVERLKIASGLQRRAMTLAESRHLS